MNFYKIGEKWFTGNQAQQEVAFKKEQEGRYCMWCLSKCGRHNSWCATQNLGFNKKTSPMVRRDRTILTKLNAGTPLKIDEPTGN